MKKNSFPFFYSNLISFFSKSHLSLFPIREALQKNPLQWDRDIKAGISVMLLALPQGIAYASIANLPIMYGLIGSAIACCIGPLFSSSNYTILGPTNASAFTLFGFFATLGVSSAEKIAYIPLFTFLVGIFCIFGALFKISEMLQYISRSVLTGYLTGAAILIITNQIKYLFQIEEYISGKTFFIIFGEIFEFFHYIHFPSLIVGMLTLLVYWSWKKFFPQHPHFILTLILFTGAIASINHFWDTPLRELSTFESVSSTAKSFDISGIAFFDSIVLLSGGAFAFAFLASMENTLTVRSIASKTDERADLNQASLSLGITNIFCSIFSGMPASGSLTRSALNYNSQAASRFATLFCGVLCFGLIYLFIQFPILITSIPKTCIAALIISIGIGLFQKYSLKICFRSTFEDSATLVCTLVATLLMPIHTAIFIGIITSVLLFLKRASHPELKEYILGERGDFHEIEESSKRTHPEISIIHIEGNLFFGGASIFYEQISHILSEKELRIIILRMRNTLCLDATCLATIEDLIKNAREKDKHILFAGVTPPIYKTLKSSGVLKTLEANCSGKETNLFLYNSLNPNQCAREALKRAQEILGHNAEINIFYTKEKES